MDFVENVWVGEERTQTGVCAEIDGPATIFDAWKVCRIGVAEDAPAEGNKAWMFLLFEGFERHTFVMFFPLRR